MASNKIHIENIDELLCTIGYTYPKNYQQLDGFNTVFKDYDYKLSNVSIDVDSILKNKLVYSLDIINMKDNSVDDISELRMVARKGIEGLPKDIIDKMYGKHRDKSDDKE